jgi:hypothetical protein
MRRFWTAGWTISVLRAGLEFWGKVGSNCLNAGKSVCGWGIRKWNSWSVRGDCANDKSELGFR